MLLSLGLFIFEIGTLPYQELSRQSAWRHPETSRVGTRAGRQFVGVGTETITLTGSLVPEITGGAGSIEMLRQMADEGKAWPLVAGNGKVYGLFVIEAINDRSSTFFKDGTARKIDFDITLARVGDDQIDLIGSLVNALGGLFA